MFRNLSNAYRSQPPQQERTEPRLVPPNAPIQLRRPLEPDPDTLTATRDNAARPPIAPVIPGIDRRLVPPAMPQPGSLRYVALAGCIVFAIAGAGGAGFLLFTTPAKETAGEAAASSPSGLPMNDTTGPASPDAAPTHHAATAAIPGPSAPTPPAAHDTAAKTPESGPPAAPAASPGDAKPGPANKQRATPAPVPEKPTPPVNPVSAAPQMAARHAAEPAEAAPDRRAASPPAETRRLHRHVAERHAHLRSARELRSPSLQPGAGHPSVAQQPKPATRSARSSAPQQADQNAAFDQLLSHLTGSAKPADQSSNQTLSPPAAGAADPFAPHPPTRSFDQ